MLLETLTKNKNNLIIFSQNIFDFDNNFKILNKDVPDKKIIKVPYREVCKFVDLDIPKNLLVYRLLTNIKKFEILYPKYGYYVLIQGSPELIYFDPVFAVKELENFDEELDFENLRFRIQQVGLTLFSKKNNLPVYRELYAIDLKADEAQNQNDSIFVEAYLSKLALNKYSYQAKLKEAGKKTIEDLKPPDKKIPNVPGVPDKKTNEDFNELENKIPKDLESLNKKIPTLTNKFESFEERFKQITERATELEKLKLKKAEDESKAKLQKHGIEEDDEFDSSEVVKLSIANFLKAKPNFFTVNENERILNNTLAGTCSQEKSDDIEIKKSEFSDFLKSKRTSNVNIQNAVESKKADDQQKLEVFETNPEVNKKIAAKRDKRFVLRIKD